MMIGRTSEDLYHGDAVFRVERLTTTADPSCDHHFLVVNICAAVCAAEELEIERARLKEQLASAREQSDKVAELSEQLRALEAKRCAEQSGLEEQLVSVRLNVLLIFSSDVARESETICRNRFRTERARDSRLEVGS